jgi:hypothetical protein
MKCTQTEKLLAKRALGILPLRVAHKLEEHRQSASLFSRQDHLFGARTERMCS